MQVLTSRGRLSFRDLAMFTKLKLRALRAAILALVQHNLLWHSDTNGEEMFEFNTDECLARLRYGKYLLLAKELFGEEVRIFYLILCSLNRMFK